jgi:hypothetical protein
MVMMMVVMMMILSENHFSRSVRKFDLFIMESGNSIKAAREKIKFV